jgi:hypothetical protein
LNFAINLAFQKLKEDRKRIKEFDDKAESINEHLKEAADW